MHWIDLHTHSVESPDGALRLEDYRRMLTDGGLGTIAITDHDTVAFALAAQRELGPGIVVGEEVSTTEGEVVGLYLREAVAAGQSALATARAIHAQGGLVYVPHPFERVRRGVTMAVLDGLGHEVDIMEAYNGRAWWRSGGRLVAQWAHAHGVAVAASSDAHGWAGWGRTGSVVSARPERETLLELLGGAELMERGVGLRGRLYPKLNRLRRLER